MAKKRAPGAREKARQAALALTRKLRKQLRIIESQIEVLKADLGPLENHLADMAYSEPENDGVSKDDSDPETGSKTGAARA